MSFVHLLPATTIDPGATFFCADTGLGLLSFTGPDTDAFLQGQLSSDLKALQPGILQLSSYNSPKGRMLATLMLWRDDSEKVRALVAADLVESLRKRLSMYVMRSKVVVADQTPSRALRGVSGPDGRAAVQTIFGLAPAPGNVDAIEAAALVGLPDGRIVVVTQGGHTDALAARLAAHATPVSNEYWRWLGIRAGVPTIQTATQDLFVPQTANMDLLGGVNFQKGCYPGQEIVARTQYLGRLKERMHLFHVDALPPPPAARIYSEIFGDQACGTVVDAAPAPDGGTDLLAVVQLSTLDGLLRLGATDGPTLAPLPLPYSIPAAVAPNRPKL